MSAKINPGDTARGGAFYGWKALSGSTLVALIAGGAWANSYGVFLPVICKEFGWSRAMVAAGFSLGMLFFGLPSPLTGFLVDRFGPKINLVLGNLLMALALAGMSMVTEVWHIYVLLSLVGLGSGIGGIIPSITVVNNWFFRKRPLAMGVFSGTAASGGFIFPPLVTVLIAAIGWRMSWLVLAGIVLVGACLIGGSILVRNRPEDMGQVPDGAPAGPAMAPGTAVNSSGPDIGQGWQTRQAIRQPTTWLIAGLTAASFLAFQTMGTHQVAFMQDSGFSPMVAAMTLSLVSAWSVVGRLGFGVMALKWKVRNLAIAGLSMQTVSLVILLSTRSLGFIYVYTALFGIGNGLVFVVMPTLIGTYYGRSHYARIAGAIFPLQFIAGAAGPAIAGLIFDSTGAYTSAFFMIAAFGLVGLVCAFLAKPPKLPQPHV